MKISTQRSSTEADSAELILAQAVALVHQLVPMLIAKHMQQRPVQVAPTVPYVSGGMIQPGNRLVFTLSDGSAVDVGIIQTLRGKQGVQGNSKRGQRGAPGRGIKDVKRADANIVFVYSDDAEVDLGPLPVGPPGPVGEPGPRGDRGEQGYSGRAGEPGPPGEPGPIGLQGPRGEIGPEGSPGRSGERGEMGPPGINGERGLRGFTGETGAAGRDGEPGSPGEQGPPGKDGNDGAPGINGRDGVDGLPGIQGVSVTKLFTDGNNIKYRLSDGNEGVAGEIKAGPRGLPGVGISRIYRDAEGNVVFGLTDGSAITIDREPSLPGPSGPSGTDGVGIGDITLKGPNLIIALSDGRVIDVGRVVGRDAPMPDLANYRLSEAAEELIGRLVQQAIYEANMKTKAELTPDGELVVTLGESKFDLGVVTGAPGPSGRDGKDGRDGVPGPAGKDGARGADGRGVNDIQLENGIVRVNYSDGASHQLGPLTPPRTRRRKS